MPLSELPYVEEGKFPRDVRSAVNEIADRLNTQKWEVKFTEDLSPQAAKVEMSDDRVVILIPRGGLLGSVLRGGFSLQYQTKPKNGGGVDYQWAVYPGFLKNTQSNIDNGDSEYLTVTGCLTRTATGFSRTDAVWANIPTGGTLLNPARLWIEVAATTWPSVDSAFVNNAPWGGGELEYVPDMNTPPNNIQTAARFVVGQVSTYINGVPQIAAFPGCAQLQLVNGWDTAFDSAHSNGAACPVWFPVVT